MIEPLEAERILGHRGGSGEQGSGCRRRRASARSAGDPGAYVCLTNVHTTVESQRSPALRRAVDDAFLSVPDGMPLVWILRRRGHLQTEKVTGIEYIPLVASRGLDLGLRHFFYGGAPGVAVRAGLAPRGARSRVCRSSVPHRRRSPRRTWWATE